MRPTGSGIVSAVFTLSVAGSSWAAPVGDVNGDGTTDSGDTEALVGHLLGSSTLNQEEAERADTNANGHVDVGDGVQIVNIVHPPGPGLIPVPAGPFRMGNPWMTTLTDTQPVHEVYLSAYQISRFEVRTGEFVDYLNAALMAGEVRVVSGEVFRNNMSDALICQTNDKSFYSQIDFSGGVFSPHVHDGVSTESHQVVRITWFGAAAYCNWLSRQQALGEAYTELGDWPCNLATSGFRLPTEAEWERAAAWDPDHMGSTSVPLPPAEAALGHWRYGFASDTLPLFTRANYYDTTNGRYANPLSFLGQPYTSPVGFYDGVNVGRSGQTVDSPSPLGCYDMSGGAAEWCNDWYAAGYYSISPPMNPPGADTGTERVRRGGSWYDSDYLTATATRNKAAPGILLNGSGFRRARRM